MGELPQEMYTSIQLEEVEFCMQNSHPLTKHHSGYHPGRWGCDGRPCKSRLTNTTIVQGWGNRDANFDLCTMCLQASKCIRLLNLKHFDMIDFLNLSSAE
jgi:hypothetical protein